MRAAMVPSTCGLRGSQQPGPLHRQPQVSPHTPDLRLTDRFSSSVFGLIIVVFKAGCE